MLFQGHPKASTYLGVWNGWSWCEVGFAPDRRLAVLILSRFFKKLLTFSTDFSFLISSDLSCRFATISLKIPFAFYLHSTNPALNIGTVVPRKCPPVNHVFAGKSSVVKCHSSHPFFFLLLLFSLQFFKKPFLLQFPVTKDVETHLEDTSKGQLRLSENSRVRIY